jgi:hypothetical protein
MFPVAVVATPVTVMLYVPGVAFVTTGVVPPLEVEVVELLLEPHPLAEKAPTESSTTNNALQRRRRGNATSSRQARLAPEPATYHGAFPVCGAVETTDSLPVPVLALLCEAVRTKLVVPAALELMTTGFTEKV